MAAGSESLPNQPVNRGHSATHWLLFLVLLIVAAILIYFFAWRPRHEERKEINQQARERTETRPRVEVMRISGTSAANALTIPGTTLAYTEAYIYARASGYVTRRLVDIGDRVRKGQLLALIDAPDLDQQVAQARSALTQSEASLRQTEAQLHLAQVNWDRYKVLVAKGVFSRQDGDTQEANLRVADANVGAARSIIQGNRDNLQRLIVLQEYERVTAPFSGVITARNVDVGTLISAQGTGQGASASASAGTTLAGAQGLNSGASGSLSSSVSPSTGGAQGGEMFAMAALDPLRVLVSVPESYASIIHVGQKADLFFQDSTRGKAQGKVTRTSSSINQNTRTLLVEVQVANPNGRFLPGMYVMAGFAEARSESGLLIPGESIIVRGGKTMVGVVEDNHVHFQPIQIGRDYGEQTQITDGLKPGDIIVKIVTDQVQDGVEIEPQYPPQGKGGAK